MMRPKSFVAFLRDGLLNVAVRDGCSFTARRGIDVTIVKLTVPRAEEGSGLDCYLF